jgi:hypothetical protein
MSMSAEVDGSFADSLSTRNEVAGFTFVYVRLFILAAFFTYSVSVC